MKQEQIAQSRKTLRAMYAAKRLAYAECKEVESDILENEINYYEFVSMQAVRGEATAEQLEYMRKADASWAK